MELPERKANRLEDSNYRNPGYYFITICTKHKEKTFWQGEQYVLSHAGQIAEKYILSISEHYSDCRVDQYVIMPNHIHMVLVLDGYQRGATSVSTVIGQYKRIVSRTLEQDVWQKGFYDHVIRGETDYREIWEYIENYPAKWMDDCFNNDY